MQNGRECVGGRLGLRVGLVAFAAAAVCSTGCYERVTRARGLGADQYDVSEPYQENSAVDDWIFGPQESSRNRQGSLLNR